MKIREISHGRVHTSAPTDTLASSIETMSFYDIGALPVLDEGVLVGIISERDVMHAVADGVDPAVEPVGSYMTAGPVAVIPDDDTFAAVELMVKHGTRHLPVVAGGLVIGIVSARDLLARSNGKS